MARKLYEIAENELVAVPSDIGLTWVDKTSVSTAFVFECDTYNELRKFTGNESLSFTLPVPPKDKCAIVAVHMDLTAATASGIPSITLGMPSGNTLNVFSVSGDTLAKGSEYTIYYSIRPTAEARTYAVVCKTSRIIAVSKSVFMLDAEGNVVVDMSNVRSDGTVAYDGDVLGDGTVRIDIV